MAFSLSLRAGLAALIVLMTLPGATSAAILRLDVTSEVFQGFNWYVPGTGLFWEPDERLTGLPVTISVTYDTEKLRYSTTGDGSGIDAAPDAILARSIAIGSTVYDVGFGVSNTQRTSWRAIGMSGSGALDSGHYYDFDFVIADFEWEKLITEMLYPLDTPIARTKVVSEEAYWNTFEYRLLEIPGSARPGDIFGQTFHFYADTLAITRLDGPELPSVPVPAAGLLLPCGIGALALLRGRRQKRSADAAGFLDLAIL